MSTLQAIQREMLEAVLAANGPAPSPIQGDARATAASRLAVYRHAYRIRLRDALASAFHGLKVMAGRHFDGLLGAYIQAHPSAHYNIRWHGADLAGFLQRAHREKPQLADMARLDWAISVAFDAADEPGLDAAQLLAVPPAAWADLRFLLRDNLHLLSFAHNIDAFRRAADRDAARPRLRRYAKPCRMLIWRHASTVHYRRLDEEEWRVLHEARRGAPFAALCAVVAETHGEAAAARMAALLQGWVGAGLLRGLALPEGL